MADEDRKHVEAFKEDIGALGWLFVCDVGEFEMDFKAFQGTAREIVGPCGLQGPVQYSKRLESGQGWNGFTLDWREAVVMFEGFVKWDGCLEFSLPSEIHVCGHDELEEFAKALLTIHVLAKAHMPKFDPETAGMELA